MITLFKADDGKIFEDEDECLRYEKMLEYGNKNDSIIFADEDGKIFSLNDIIKDYNFAEKIFYVYAKNHEGWRAGYEFVSKEYGYMFPDWQDFWDESSHHCWFWNEKGFCNWVDFDEACKELNEKSKIFDKMMVEIT